MKIKSTKQLINILIFSSMTTNRTGSLSDIHNNFPFWFNSCFAISQKIECYEIIQKLDTLILSFRLKPCEIKPRSSWTLNCGDRT